MGLEGNWGGGVEGVVEEGFMVCLQFGRILECSRANFILFVFINIYFFK